MSAVLPWLLLVALAVHFGAHVALVVALARQPRTDANDPALHEGGADRHPLVRAVIAFFVSPLAALWGWKMGKRRTTVVWCAGLAAYALGVALA